MMLEAAGEEDEQFAATHTYCTWNGQRHLLLRGDDYPPDFFPSAVEEAWKDPEEACEVQSA